MILPLLPIVAWLMLGHAVLAALFWGLVQVPESTLFMVTLSALLVVLMVVVAAWVEVFALLRLRRAPGGATAGTTSGADSVTQGGGSSLTPGGASSAPTAASRVRIMGRAVPAFLVALAVFGIVFGATGRAATWLMAHRGQIDAWMIVHAKTVKTALLHGTLGWILWFVRYGFGLSISLALLLQLATDGVAAIRRFSWLAAGLRPWRMLLVALCVFACVWVPWQAIYWRPKALPATWLEPAFVMTKLLVIYLLANVGWALALNTAARQSGGRR